VKKKADVVIVGGGIMGLATAYYLAKRGRSDVVVLDREYLCGGASGRNGGGVRAQFATETNIRLMQQSIELCKEFANEMGINVWFRQGGYLFLVKSQPALERLEKVVAIQNACGLRTRILEPKEIPPLVPELSLAGIVAASFNPDDGVVFPWPFLWGYARAAEKMGVEVHTFTDVLGIDAPGGRVARVRTTRGAIETRVVVNAAGAWTPEVARMVGLELPNHPHRHEIMSTEPLKPFLGPLVADLENGLYFSQSLRGEIVGGIGDAKGPDELDQRSSFRFLVRYARALTERMPVLARIKALRQWAGCYDITPDGNPIFGPVRAVEGFYLMAGFMGHGFMMAPVVSRILANHLVDGSGTDIMTRWSLERFDRGDLVPETMIIG
jgi:sarcosine oxidase subunit beta